MGAPRCRAYTASKQDDKPLENPATILLSNTGRSLYREFELGARYHFKGSNPWVVSYVRSRSYGGLNDFTHFYGNFENPVLPPECRAFGQFSNSAPLNIRSKCVLEF